MRTITGKLAAGRGVLDVVKCPGARFCCQFCCQSPQCGRGQPASDVDIWRPGGGIDGEGGGTRTRDSRIKSPLLYRLSYAPARPTSIRRHNAAVRCD